MDATTKPQKIAILGGGVGAMSTAFQLTEEPDWQTKYDITVYQMGWRLGGKGASGRAGSHGRIQEHGLHIWLGFYENAFRMIQKVYGEFGKTLPADAPIRTWQDAFHEHSLVSLAENINNEWKVWPVHFPIRPGMPGDGSPPPTLWQNITLTLEWLKEMLKDSAFARVPLAPEDAEEHQSFLGRVKEIWHDAKSDFDTEAIGFGIDLLEAARAAAESMPNEPTLHANMQYEGIIALIERFLAWLWKQVQPIVDKDDEARRLFTVMDLGVTVVRGLLRDGVFTNPLGLDSLEDEFLAWLRRHGASEMSADIRQSAVVRGLYDLVFAFEDGQISRPSFAAGPALRSILKIAHAYKGSIFWKMQAGMGDIVFAPIYRVLKDRGVKFEFFHVVEDLILTEDQKSVAAIRVRRQIHLKDPSKEYDPLVDVNGVPSWPQDALYEQIVEGQALIDGQINLESYWTPWQNVETRVLQAGSDFDKVVLGISIGSFPYICSELMARSESFRLMVENVKTVRTQALQLWMNVPLQQLGWTQGSTVMDAYVEPMNTWADMSHLIPREQWEGPGAAQSIHYFCGAMTGDIPPKADHDAPARAEAEVKETSRSLLAQSMGFLWPLAVNAAGFRWELLCDDGNAQGEARLDSQYWHANIDPSERYVLSPPGATQYRLSANESGFDNVILAGDWTNNGFNAGCVEAAVMSGMRAVNALAGRPLDEGISGLPEQV